MSLIETRKIIWDDIIFEMKNIWEHMKLVVEPKSVVKTTKFLILSSKNEDTKNARAVEKFIRYLNEKSSHDLRAMDIIDMTCTIIEVFKMIKRK